jgi:hypothetical protein
MTLYEQIIEVYSELTDADLHAVFGSILLQDDSDGQGAFIAKWEYSQPIPSGMKVGK